MSSWKRKFRRNRSSGPTSPVWLLFFFGLFALVGLLIGLFWALPTATEALNSRSWNQVPATVVESAVDSHRSSDSTTYSIQIVFTYTVDGRSYQSDRWDMIEASSSGYDSKKRVVDAHPPGKKITVYVNPDSPEIAVINPGLNASALLFLIPVVFFLIGATGLVVTATKVISGKKSRGNSGAKVRFFQERPVQFQTHSPEGQIALKPQLARWQKALLFLGIAIFWNGVVSIFVFEIVEGWRAGKPDWGLTLFISLFVIVGVFLLGLFVHQLLALRNPHIKPVITPGHSRLGGPLCFTWEMSGETSRLNNLVMQLECRESVVRRSGKNSSTTTHVIYRQEIVKITDRLSMRSGKVDLRLPGEAMHSFKAGNCSIDWFFVVQGEISGWPDLKEEFLFWMNPHNA